MKDYIWKAMELIRESEGLRLTAYKPTPDDVWTIGFGHTGMVPQNAKVTLIQAYEYLLMDITSADNAVDNLVKIILTDNQRVAIISLIFNVGVNSFRKSRALKALNRSNLELFKWEAFSRTHGWTRQNGKILRGLVNRRHNEHIYFTTPA